ncbi:MAG: hypothetical protein ACI4W6_09395, partial [Acutalibacteraceae bacterium]
MQAKKKKDDFPSVTVICLFVLAGLLHSVHLNSDFIRTVFFVLSTAIYSGIIICWIVYIRKRFISDRIRKLLVSMAFFLLFYIFLRTVKYRYIFTEGYPEMSRF